MLNLIFNVISDTSCMDVSDLYKLSGCCDSSQKSTSKTCPDINFEGKHSMAHNADYIDNGKLVNIRDFFVKEKVLREKYTQIFGNIATEKHIGCTGYCYAAKAIGYKDVFAGWGVTIPSVGSNGAFNGTDYPNWNPPFTCKDEETVGAQRIGFLKSSETIIPCPSLDKANMLWAHNGVHSGGDPQPLNGRVYVSHSWSIRVFDENNFGQLAAIVPYIEEDTSYSIDSAYRFRMLQTVENWNGELLIDNNKIYRCGFMLSKNDWNGEGAWRTKTKEDFEKHPFKCIVYNLNGGKILTNLQEPDEVFNVDITKFDVASGVDGHFRDIKIYDNELYLVAGLQAEAFQPVRFNMETKKTVYGKVYDPKSDMRGFSFNVNKDGAIITTRDKTKGYWEVVKWPSKFEPEIGPSAIVRLTEDAYPRDHVDDGIDRFAGFYGASQANIKDDTLYFVGWKNFYWLKTDFTSNSIATVIEWPNEIPRENYTGNIWNFMVRSSDKYMYMDVGIVNKHKPPYTITDRTRTVFGYNADTSHTVQSYVYKIDPQTKKVVDRIQTIFEDGIRLCKCGGISADDSWGYYYCSKVGPEDTENKMMAQKWGHQDIFRFRLSSKPVEMTSETSTSSNAVTLTSFYESERDSLNKDKSAFVTKISPEGMHTISPSGVEYVKLDATKQALLKLDRDKRNVLIGNGIAHMGHPKDSKWNINSTIVIGTHSANMEKGFSNSIIIGNNIENEQHDSGKTDIELMLLSAKTPITERLPLGIFPKKNILSIGMNGNTLLHGNFEKKTLNFPSLNPLGIAIKSSEEDLNVKKEGLLFSRYNIVQTVNNGYAKDGVQVLLDKISILELNICKLTNRLDNKDPSTCVLSSPTPFTTMYFRYDTLYGETIFELKYRSSESNPWTTVISFKNKPENYVMDSFELSLNLDERKALYEYSGALLPGQYHMTHTDDYGDGFQTSGIPYTPNVDPIFYLGTAGNNITTTTGSQWADGVGKENTGDKSIYFSYPSLKILDITE